MKRQISKAILLFSLLMLRPVYAQDYERYSLSILENGGFELGPPDTANLGAYWLIAGDSPRVPAEQVTRDIAHEGLYSLSLEAGDTVWQYLPGVREYSDSLKISGAIMLSQGGAARLHLKSSDGRTLIYCLTDEPFAPPDDTNNVYLPYTTATGSWVTFELNAGMDYISAYSDSLYPRFTLRLECTDGQAFFDVMQVTTDIYWMAPELFLETVLDEMAWTFDLWIEKGLDREGPEETPCVSKIHDAITGANVQTLSQCPVWSSYPIMTKYLAYRDNPDYFQLVVDQADLFLRTRNRETGFTRYWDPLFDEATGNVALLPISYFWQIFDLTGDEQYRTAALELTDTLLVSAQGAWESDPVPEGYLHSSYYADGSVRNLHPHQYDIMIRWFDVVRPLSEAYKRSAGAHRLEAMETCAELYITPGTIEYNGLTPSTINFQPRWYSWENLIPSFDDYFGYGIQGLWRVWESGNFVHSGIETYLKEAYSDMGGEWWKAMLRGGREAGDESRGWQPYYWALDHDSVEFEAHRQLLIRNGWSVFKGEFGEYGSWMGTGYEDWSPIIGLPGEGGTTGASGNALTGLFLAWEASGRNEDFYAAMVTLFRTSQLTYKFDYGYIRTPAPDPVGPNPAGGEFRYISGFFPLFEALGLSGVEHSPDQYAPASFSLSQNYPNPFNLTTSIPLRLMRSGVVCVSIYSVTGRKIRRLYNGELNAGLHILEWDGRDDEGRPAATGIYLLKAGTFMESQSRKLLLVK